MEDLDRDFNTAVRTGRVDEVKALLNKGADANTIDYYDGPVMIPAAERGYVEIVRLLIDRGSNVDAERHDGKWPLKDKQARP